MDNINNLYSLRELYLSQRDNISNSVLKSLFYRKKLRQLDSILEDMDRFLENGIILCDPPKFKRKIFSFGHMGITVVITSLSLELSVFKFGHPVNWDSLRLTDSEKGYILECKNKSEFITIKEFEEKYNVSVVIESTRSESENDNPFPIFLTSKKDKDIEAEIKMTGLTEIPSVPCVGADLTEESLLMAIEQLKEYK